MKVKDIVAMFKKHNPLTVRQVEKHAGMKLEELGSGEFRKAFRIVGTDLVVKFPLATDDIEHSRVEYQRCHDIMRQPKWYLLRKYIPKVYHFNPNTGVLIMHYYEPVIEATPKIMRDITWIQKLVDMVCRDNGIVGFGEEELNWVTDIGLDNLGVTPDGNYKFIDMGFFEVEDDLDNEGKG